MQNPNKKQVFFSFFHVFPIRCFCLLVLGLPLAANEPIEFKLVERCDVAPAWSGHPVGFALLTEGDQQFVAFYDAEQNLTMGQRRLDEKEWKFKRLPTKIGWDSHNYVTMAVDRNDILHVSGNMHCVPLIYFRSEKKLDIESLEQVTEMVGSEEKRCTYPQFIEGPQNEFIFTYRDGSSGNGNQIWNIYNPATRKWKRLLDQPMFDGQGKMNAYFCGPIIGPDGYYHMSWMWRDTPDCSTNHDLSYMKSKDLKNWVDSNGKPVKLPVTLQTGEIIDPAQPGGGLLNPAQRVGFDLDGRVVISYGKYDENGNYQIYNARREADGWKYYQATNWNYRWDFKGGGSIVGEVNFGALEIEDGKLTQSYSHHHTKEGVGKWFLDEKTLKPTSRAPGLVRWPREIGKIELDFPKLRSGTAWDMRDKGRDFSDDHQIRYVMKWETQESNRDRPHPQTPSPTMLRIYKMESLPRKVSNP